MRGLSKTVTCCDHCPCFAWRGYGGDEICCAKSDEGRLIAHDRDSMAPIKPPSWCPLPVVFVRSGRPHKHTCEKCGTRIGL